MSFDANKTLNFSIEKKFENQLTQNKLKVF